MGLHDGVSQLSDVLGITVSLKGAFQQRKVVIRENAKMLDPK